MSALLLLLLLLRDAAADSIDFSRLLSLNPLPEKEGGFFRFKVWVVIASVKQGGEGLKKLGFCH